MTGKTMAITVFPAILAIMLEIFPPISEGQISAQLVRLFGGVGGGMNDALKDGISSFARGTATLASLPPTGIAIVAGVLDTLNEVPNSLPWTLLVIGMAVGGCYVFLALAAYVDIYALTTRLPHRRARVPLSDYISRVVILLNVVVILFCVVAYVFLSDRT